MDEQQPISPVTSVLLGGAAGSIAEVVVLPALVVRTRMMVQGADRSLTAYSSFGDAIRTIYRTEGVGAFYKGLGLNVLFTPLARGLYMAGAELSKETLGEGTALTDFAVGMNAQLLASIAYIPRDIVVERCAIDGQLKSQVGSTASSAAALRTILSAEGLAGFYRAFLPHQLVWVPFNGIFFAALGKLKEAEAALGVKTEERYLLGVANTFASAGVAAAATNPIDVVKTRLQVAGANPDVFSYRGPIDCLAKLIRAEGPAALFAGLVGRFLYAGPGFAIFLPTYDVLKRLALSGAGGAPRLGG
ncbi:hypothetical protein EMIHUDRAFT_460467 [Emiliania huxleyi CCMP1516]|uniref:Uncharacterized protein n=2 Tax=Emiliania huxleyi TaxID=2903 RepID=A0A0D3KRA0_EMIH1|nr:mitochondrial substrate carrier family protein [Emiliania huxleyi CCMP1516]XP_005790714.1 hypothetical protein EMIHUDRAFT_460467 [Emiliania huxleyi CCMP1516]EOD33103.1 mitochondrial substrate carrier family protein [Emiliania huxleyi CCMP1516]EOD38285.1 hypothetical protein EMIHUDRAFT_460467 [Emiliania huxleyi CCMP1516]|eukprot:XP_005785532.1 mitochondrial substrate carrier family protein [Emiliania huxleyi CCMP1516]